MQSSFSNVSTTSEVIPIASTVYYQNSQVSTNINLAEAIVNLDRANLVYQPDELQDCTVSTSEDKENEVCNLFTFTEHGVLQRWPLPDPKNLKREKQVMGTADSDFWNIQGDQHFSNETPCLLSYILILRHIYNNFH